MKKTVQPKSTSYAFLDPSVSPVVKTRVRIIPLKGGEESVIGEKRWKIDGKIKVEDGKEKSKEKRRKR